MSNATELKRRLPDGSVMHQLSLPEAANLQRYIDDAMRAKLEALRVEYANVQTAVVPELLAGVTAQVLAGASMFARLKGILDDGECGVHSEDLQRSHDSNNRLRKWRPVYEQIQAKLVEIEDRRNAILKELAEQLKQSKDYSTRYAGSELGYWVNSLS